MKNTLVLILISFLFSCQKQTIKCNLSPGEVPNYTFYINFMDSLGNDYLLSHGIKFTEFYYIPYQYTADDSLISIPRFEIKDTFVNNRYVFRIKANFDKALIKISDKIIDTVIVTGDWRNYCDKNKYYDSFFKDTIQNFIYLHEIYYNEFLLTPPQFKKEGVWNIHRIVIREDF